MLTVILVTGAVAAVAGYVYVIREQLGPEGAGLAALRTLGIGFLVWLFVNPGSSERRPGGEPVVLLDASLSMAAPGGQWEAAVDTALFLAGAKGSIYQFGSGVKEFGPGTPDDGASRISAALRAAAALGGPVYVVTDGELDDAGIVDPRFLEDVSFVMLPRDTVSDVAILEVDVPGRVSTDDSIGMTVTLGSWGDVGSTRGNLEVLVEGRRILTREVEIPAAPGVARRRLVLPPTLLPRGTNIIEFRIEVPGDDIRDDDERAKIVLVTEQPAVVVLLDPPDWEGRFLVTELAQIARTTVRGYAHVTPDAWVDMGSGLPIPEESVQRIARSASLLLVRGGGESTPFAQPRHPVWWWPTQIGELGSAAQHDWYLSGMVQASPLAGRLASVLWDSLPPVLGLGQQRSDRSDWVALSARQGRRGAERAAVTGMDSAGTRSLTTFGTGWWRWRLRGEADREAYRTLLASGVDWLLGSERAGSPSPLVSSTVVSRGEPTLFEWVRDSVPGSLEVSLLRDGDDSSSTRNLLFDSRGVASVSLLPGTYQWLTPEIRGGQGVTVVEEYSDEFHPRMVADLVGGNAGGMILLERYTRDNWWLFVVVVVALSAEWAWRHRRGLS